MGTFIVIVNSQNFVVVLDSRILQSYGTDLPPKTIILEVSVGLKDIGFDKKWKGKVRKLFLGELLT